MRWRKGIDVTDDEEATCNEHSDCSVATLGFRRRRESDAVRRDKEAGGRRFEAIDTLALYLLIVTKRQKGMEKAYICCHVPFSKSSA